MVSFEYLLKLRDIVGDATDITGNTVIESLQQTQATIEGLSSENSSQSEKISYLENEMTKVKDLLAPLDLSQFPTTEFVQNLVNQLGISIGSQLTAITARLNALVAKAASYALATIDQSNVLAPTAEFPFLHAIVQHNLNSTEVAIEFFDNDGDSQLLPIVKRNADSVVINMSTVDPVGADENYKLIVIGGYSEVEPEVEPTPLAVNQYRAQNGSVLELLSSGELIRYSDQGLPIVVGQGLLFVESFADVNQILAQTVDSAEDALQYLRAINVNQPLEPITEAEYLAHRAQANDGRIAFSSLSN